MHGHTLRVDFYVIAETAAAARLKLACRLAEKAYRAAQRTLIWHTDRVELEALDGLLWTFADGSFVPHEWLTSNGFPRVSSGTDNSRGRVSEGSSDSQQRISETDQAPVLLSAGSPPVEAFDFVVNLAAEPPPFLELTPRIAEIIDGDEGRRQAGRARFKTYRELGIEPSTHTIPAS